MENITYIKRKAYNRHSNLMSKNIKTNLNSPTFKGLESNAPERLDYINTTIDREFCSYNDCYRRGEWVTNNTIFKGVLINVAVIFDI